MKYVFNDLEKIKKKIKKLNFVLLLDFDLTLSPLAKNPANATLPKDTRVLLKKLSNYINIAIITGRNIKDIKKRTKLHNIIYVGNHGLEYEIKGITKSTPLSTLSKKGLKDIKKKFLNIKRKYSGIIVEDKKLTMALHYRLLLPEDKLAFLADIKNISLKVEKNGLCGTLYKKTLEIRPNIKKDKGTASLFVLKKFGNKKQVIYIGDGKTDEDAFRVLSYEITIKVEKSKSSLANYYLHNTHEVKKFLAWILSIIQFNEHQLKVQQVSATLLYNRSV